MNQPLMPHATACWLIENTALSFPQIADFCGLHMLEVLCSQRELDAIVAKAAKKAGLEAPTDARLDGAKAALIEELRRERDDAASLADESEEAAAAVETVAPAAPAGGTSLKDEADRLFDPNYARGGDA